MAVIPNWKTKRATVSCFDRGRSRFITNNSKHLNCNFSMPLHMVFTTYKFPADWCPYLQLLHSCIGKNVLSQGKEICSLITHSRFACTGTFPQNKLIDMYVKCGSLANARKVFDEMTERNRFSWNVLISAYRRHGYPHEALILFHDMQQTGIQPDQFTFASILPACARIGDLKQGMFVHQSIMENGFLSDVLAVSALIDMYSKCGSIQKARELFNNMPQRNVVSWNSMIAGYAQYGILDEASRLFKEMPRQDVVSWNAIITGYAQNGVFDEALRLFNEMPQRNVVSWNAIIAGYAQNGFVEKALETFKQMQLVGINPNSTTFASVLPACSKIRDLDQGMAIHQNVIESGLLSDVVVVSALVDMYAKCGSIRRAREVFDKMPQRNVFSWNAMIAGYAQNDLLDEALILFNEMPQKNVVSWNTMIAGYAQNGVLDKSLKFFKEMPQRNSVSWNTMIAGYAQLGALDEASSFFIEMPEKNVVSWTTMIAGYAHNGYVEKASETFRKMQVVGIKPNATTFASILPACAKMGALEHGMDIHHRVIECGFSSDIIIASALVDMYAKCGRIHKARELFDKMPQRNVVSWTAMIAGYAMHGFRDDALELFKLMKPSGTLPDHVSLVCVLFACSHVGLVDEGCKYFNDMTKSYCIMPTMDHYICMVDLLGRAGYLEEALNLIIKMPIKPAITVWMSFLGACRSHKNIGLGLFIANLLFGLDPKNTAPFVLLSNIYAEIGIWDEVQQVRRLMKDRGIKKMPGCSWIEVNKIVHAFGVGDRSHPQTHEIYATLEKLSQEMKAAGYSPDSRHGLNDVVEEEKELFLCHHSEKLAIAFGLLNTSPGTTIRIVKNLRVCIECHTATKFISKIVARKIVVRDANRFHHFEEGECSCGDYW